MRIENKSINIDHWKNKVLDDGGTHQSYYSIFDLSRFLHTVMLLIKIVVIPQREHEYLHVKYDALEKEDVMVQHRTAAKISSQGESTQ